MKDKPGTTVQNRLSRLNSNGTVDTGFVPAGGGLNDMPFGLAWDGINSKLYVAGQFTTYTNGGTTTQNRLTRLNSNGTVDTTFVPAGGGLNSWANSAIWDPIASKLYVGGNFTSYTNGGSTTQNYLTRLNSNGTVDTTFIGAGNGFNSSVQSLAWDAAGSQLYVAGGFTSISNGSTKTQARLTRLSANGAVDLGFIPAGGGGLSGFVYALAWDSVNAKLYVGGQFSSYTSSGNPILQRNLTRLNSDGTVDTSFVPAGGGFSGGAFDFVTALVWDSVSSKLYVGGSFTTYTNGGGTTQNNLTRLNSNGTVDTTFVPAGGGFNDYVWTLAWDSTNSQLYAGGNFTTYTNGGTTTQNHLSRLNSNGTVDTGFVPAGGGFNQNVNALVWDGANSQLYVGGSFWNYTNGATVSQNGLTRLNSNGTVDTGFVSVGGGVDVQVNALAWDSVRSQLYVGGQFNSYTKGTAKSQKNLTRLNSDGTVDTSFVPVGGGTSSTIYALSWDPARSQLYAAGQFNTYTNGTATIQRNFTKLGMNGTVDPAWIANTRGLDGPAYALLWDAANSRVFVGGEFQSYNGVPLVGVGSLTSDGSLSAQ